MFRLFSILLLMFLNSIMFASESDSVERFNVPSQQQLKEAESLIQELLSSEEANFQDKKITATEMAEKCLFYLEEAQEPSSIYLLNQNAANYFILDYQIEKASQCYSALNEKFINVSKHEMIVDMYKNILKKTPPNQINFIFDQLLIDAEKMLEEQALDQLDHLLKIARQSRDLKKAENFKKLTLLTQKLTLMYASHKKIKSLKDELAKTPADRGLNGRYAVLILQTESSWEKALPYIQKGEDLAWAQMAQMELSEEKNATVLGDFYWSLATKTKETKLISLYKQHAVEFYSEIVDELTGLKRTLIQRRIDEVEKESESSEESPTNEIASKNKGTHLSKIKQDGSEKYPFLISTFEELDKMRLDNPNSKGKYYKLYNDIECKNKILNFSFTTTRPFEGTFDGNAKTIKNLLINADYGQYLALITFLGKDGVIKNLNIDQFVGNSTAFQSRGGAALPLTYDSYGKIINCSVTNAVISTKFGNHIGLLTGNMHGGEIDHCYVTGKIYSEIGGRVGGFVGYISNMPNKRTITNSWSNVQTSGMWNVGSFVGSSESDDLVIKFCYALGTCNDRNKKNCNIMGYSKVNAENCFYLSTDANGEERFGTARKGHEMKSTDFLRRLNANQSPKPWVKDTKKINKGYPILSK